MGGGDPPGAVPVDDPVPLVVPGDVLPVDVLDDDVGSVVAVEPSGVVGVPDVALGVVDEVPLGAGVSVGVVDDPSTVAEEVLSEGAAGLTPPLPGVVEIPPVARTLTLTWMVVVTEVEAGADVPNLVDAFAESPLATAAGDSVRATSGADGWVGAGPLDSALGVVTRAGAAGLACATLTVRV